MEYLSFFGFRDEPFRLTPDPEYYFPSDVHQETLETLLFSVRANEGFIQITGEPGLGKSMMIQTLMARIQNLASVVVVLNPSLSPQELLHTILIDLGLPPEETLARDKEVLLRAFKDLLEEKESQNLAAVVIIDEAQNLSVETLEELRLLSNLETTRKKLIQIILVGQVELDEKLASPLLKQLDQRISVRYQMKPLTPRETSAYIIHRLGIAGAQDPKLFTSKALGLIFQFSQGIPRLINMVCERALWAAFVDKAPNVDHRHVHRALSSILGEEALQEEGRRTPWSILITAGALLIIGLLAYGVYRKFQPAPQPPRPPVTGSVPSESNQGFSQGLVLPYTSGQTGPSSPGQGNPSVLPSPASAVQNLENAFYLPPNLHLLTVNQNTGQASLWKGGPIASRKIGEIPWSSPLPSGLFIVGRDKERGVFVFNFPGSFQPVDNLPKDLAWIDANLDKQINVVPVISLSSAMMPEAGKRTDLTEDIRRLVFDWVDAWRERNLKQMLTFYSEPVGTYYGNRSDPDVDTKATLFENQKDLFARSGQIDVELTDPLILIDPVNPDLAAAIFHQKTRMDDIQSEGTQVLFLQQLSENPGAPVTWKIVARLWVS